MTANIGRTVSEYTRFIIHDGTLLRSLNIKTLSAVGVKYDEHTELVGWMDAVKGALAGMPDAPIEADFIWSTLAVAAIPAESGSHTVLSVLAAEHATPRSLDIQFGERHAWEAGEPQFGITSSATSGYICTSYTVNPADGSCHATFKLVPGSALPAWGTAAET